MKNRRKRVEVIIDIINNQCIASQEQLAAQLRERGFDVTQATLSRDLKMLRTTKVATDRGTFVYTLPDSNTLKDHMLRTGQIDSTTGYQNGFISMQVSGNIAVIKTRNGYAAGLAYDIDQSNTPEILGTIPGSNTIFAVLRADVTPEQAREAVSRIIPMEDEMDMRMPKRKPRTKKS